MDPMWSVCEMRPKYIVNGAQALAIEMHDAMVANGFWAYRVNRSAGDGGRRAALSIAGAILVLFPQCVY
jgi:hypothetical protein